MIHRTFFVVLVVMLIMWLAGCAPTPPPPAVSLEKPSARLMLDIPDLPPVKPGDSIYTGYGVCRAEYGRVATTAKGLQRYVRSIEKQ